MKSSNTIHQTTLFRDLEASPLTYGGSGIQQRKTYTSLR